MVEIPDSHVPASLGHSGRIEFLAPLKQRGKIALVRVVGSDREGVAKHLIAAWRQVIETAYVFDAAARKGDAIPSSRLTRSVNLDSVVDTSRDLVGNV
jgi:hypothetical protein